jgi:hypothetical protein
MNGTSGFQARRPSTSQSPSPSGSCTSNGLNSETVPDTICSLLPVIGIVLCLSACSADLVIQGAKDPAVFHGIRVYGPANFIVTQETVTEHCPPKFTQSIVQLPLGDPYDVSVKTAWFTKSEFTVMFTDTGLLKQVTLNSTPQLAENLTAMAALAKAIGEATKPVSTFAQADCGAVLSEKINKVERFKISP